MKAKNKTERPVPAGFHKECLAEMQRESDARAFRAFVKGYFFAVVLLWITMRIYGEE